MLPTEYKGVQLIHSTRSTTGFKGVRFKTQSPASQGRAAQYEVRVQTHRGTETLCTCDTLLDAAARYAQYFSSARTRRALRGHAGEAGEAE
eukprot:3615776-Pleurochrysis_carterae.AAC.2